ncbi:MAG TPA: YkgJ family cysteine cluster protein [Terrimicrobiaceae bacterium]|jgi:Fe-S-cluster containining protein|nr:YkgJ family cysteine cluster protein [Terrimicrobiaceae bacterium]
MAKDYPFERSTCACRECVRCCHRQPGPLDNKDFEEIVRHIAKKQGASLEVAFQWVKSRLCASPGAVVRMPGGAVMRIGSITPQMRKRSDGVRCCVFLDENDRCTIHEVSPFGCRMFDTHMDGKRAMPRSIALARAQLDPEYKALRDTLPYAQSYRPQRYQA